MTINYPDGSQQGITITITVLPKEKQVTPDKDGVTETTNKEVVDASVSSAKVTPTAVTKKAQQLLKKWLRPLQLRACLKQVMRPQPMPA